VSVREGVPDPFTEGAPPAPVVRPRALPNDLPPDRLRLRPDPATGDLQVQAAEAGWRYLSFSTARIGDVPLQIGDPRREVVLIAIAGGVSIDVDGRRLELPGRASVWHGLPWAAYLPGGTWAEATSLGGEALVALADAPHSGREGWSTEPIVISPDDVTVEIRGAGNATRQITHIIPPDFPADRLLAVEVYTPGGNWSSWPPHKHDTDAMPGEAVLEEIYYYQFRRPEGWGVQRLYRRDGSRDALWAVRHGELVLVTDGYHPFAATHGYDAYYLNVLAGDRRTMACSDDPDLAWTRAAWESMDRDPRVPMVPPRERSPSG
jgi:5-deoxy-glucuronate isomerase